MRAVTIFAGALALTLTVMGPALGQPREMDAEQKAAAARLAADPALSAQANADFLASNLKVPGMLHRPDGLQYKIIQNGFGRHPNAGDSVDVYYTGKMINGTVFDGTSPGLPATFTVAVGRIIAGWVEALQMMRVGDHWQIVLPAQLAYGIKGTPDGGIPPNQALIFDLRLLAAKAPPKKGEPGYQPQPGDEDEK
jgi:FKBP-type peptidyl-prolyl cis-trans isomerase FklB